MSPWRLGRRLALAGLAWFALGGGRGSAQAPPPGRVHEPVGPSTPAHPTREAGAPPKTAPSPVGSSAPVAPPVSRTVSPARLQVTQGSLGEAGDGALRVEVPRMRAVLPGAGGDEAELHFTWLGPTQGLVPLASGELRQQVGLKLRARDACNLVYVMWRIQPRAGLVVSVKRNEGQQASSECGAGGYRNVRPRFRASLPALVEGKAHRLAARLRGDALEVRVDGVPVWRGVLGPDAAGLAGPVGVRTDNGRFLLRLEVPEHAKPPEAGGSAASTALPTSRE